jgi:putative acetyltransferase
MARSQARGVLIQREVTADVDAIRAVHRDAFGTAGGEGSVEAGLVEALRAGGEWVGELSLVAVVAGEVVGHVVCSRAWVGGVEVLGLGPLGVRRGWQRRGVGSALMHAVLGAADALGEPMVVLLGHADYYPRFGFRPARELGIAPPVAEWGEHFQVRTLTRYDPGMRGDFVYAEPFRRL